MENKAARREAACFGVWAEFRSESRPSSPAGETRVSVAYPPGASRNARPCGRPRASRAPAGGPAGPEPVRIPPPPREAKVSHAALEPRVVLPGSGCRGRPGQETLQVPGRPPVAHRRTALTAINGRRRGIPGPGARPIARVHGLCEEEERIRKWLLAGARARAPPGQPSTWHRPRAET